jgi:hypothetical protein
VFLPVASFCITPLRRKPGLTTPTQHSHANCRGIVLHSSASSPQRSSSHTPALTPKTRRLETLTRLSRPPRAGPPLPKPQATLQILQLPARDIDVCGSLSGCLDLPPPTGTLAVEHSSPRSTSSSLGISWDRASSPLIFLRGPANASLPSSCSIVFLK